VGMRALSAGNRTYERGSHHDNWLTQGGNQSQASEALDSAVVQDPEKWRTDVATSVHSLVLPTALGMNPIHMTFDGDLETRRIAKQLGALLMSPYSELSSYGSRHSCRL